MDNNLSFSDDAEESSNTQLLRDAIGQVSHRLEFVDSDDEAGPAFSPPSSSFTFVNSLERGAPDGQLMTSIQRSALSLSSLRTQPPSRERRPASSASSITCLSDGICSFTTLMLPVDLSSMLSATSQDDSTSDTFEPIDLSNSPIDLRKNLRNVDSTFICFSPDYVPEQEAPPLEETVGTVETVDSLDSFDSGRLFQHSSVPAWSQNVSNNMTYSAISPQVRARSTFLREPSDVRGEPKANAESLNSTCTSESGTDSTPCRPFKSSTSTIVAKEITNIVKAIVTTGGSLSFTQSMSPSVVAHINQTYDLEESFCIPHEEETNAFVKRADGASAAETTDGSSIMPTEVDPDCTMINKGAAASCFVDPKQSASPREQRADDTSWSVKEALENNSSGSSLKFRFTRTYQSSSADQPQRRPIEYRALERWPIILDSRLVSEISPDSIYSTRNVIGSSQYSEESTILSEASQMVPLGNTADSIAVSHPATPDITINPQYANADDSHLPTFPVSHVGKSSTPNRTHQSSRIQPRHDAAHGSLRADSPRKRLLKRRALQSHGSDSILNIGFRQEVSDAKAPAKWKNKKKALLKTIKQQLFCAKETNVSIASIANDLEVTRVHHKCLSSEGVKPSTGKQLLSKLKPGNCMKTLDDTCPTTLFATLTDSSTGLNSWCRHIRDVTRITPVLEQVVPILEQNNSSSKSAVRSDTLSSLETPDMSQTMDKSRRKTRTGSKTENVTNLDTFRHHSTPGLFSGIVENDDALFKKPLPPSTDIPNNLDGPFKKPWAPSERKISSSKSAPTLVSSSPKSQRSEKRRIQTSEPMLASTPLKRSSHRSPAFRQSRLEAGEGAYDLDTSDMRISLIEQVGRETAEWLATFVGDADSKSHRMRCDEQPNRSVLFQLCSRCKIKIQWPENDSSVFRLKKSKHSRAPTEADLQHLVRSLRRKTESVLL